MLPSLFLSNHEYVDHGECPCPLPGNEDGLIMTTWEGKPAWWSDGHIFVLVSPLEVHTARDWEPRVEGAIKRWKELNPGDG